MYGIELGPKAPKKKLSCRTGQIHRPLPPNWGSPKACKRKVGWAGVRPRKGLASCILINRNPQEEKKLEKKKTNRRPDPYKGLERTEGAAATEVGRWRGPTGG